MCSNKNYKHKFDGKFKERFFETYIVSNHDNNKFFLLLQEGVYPSQFMDDWEKFNETSLLEKEDCYNHLNMEDITDAGYALEKRVCKDFGIENLGEYNGFIFIFCIIFSKQYIFVSRGIWDFSKYLCWNIWVWSCKIYFSSWINMTSYFKKAKVKLDLLTDSNMLLMVEKTIRGRINHSIYWYAKGTK